MDILSKIKNDIFICIYDMFIKECKNNNIKAVFISTLSMPTIDGKKRAINLLPKPSENQSSS